MIKNCVFRAFRSGIGVESRNELCVFTSEYTSTNEVEDDKTVDKR